MLVQAAGAILAGEALALLYDLHGSTRMLINATGEIVDDAEHSPRELFALQDANYSLTELYEAAFGGEIYGGGGTYAEAK
ncbi:UNVERIFIED_CONTAM: hypothetical protein BEN50_22555 [Euhalothece sp. KZN 001]